jgi:hypothetical protein
MSREHVIRIIAGSFILTSLLLANYVSRHWLWFTAFVGVNLIQSAFTKWCLMEQILAKLHVGEPGGCCAPKEPKSAGCCH